MGLKAVESHIDANRKTLPTKELVADEIFTHLIKAPIMVTPEHTYYTYYYQWSEWSEDPAHRKVCCLISAAQILNRQFRALGETNSFSTLSQTHISFIISTTSIA